jgi:hypothetical protein
MIHQTSAFNKLNKSFVVTYTVGKLLHSVQQRRERYEFEGEVVDQVAEVISVMIRLRETCRRHGLVGELGSIGHCLM